MLAWQLTLILLITYWSITVTAIDRSELFPFGTDSEDASLTPADDVSSGEIKLAVPVAFYDQLYQSIYVNNDGLVTFHQAVPQFYNSPFPLNFAAMAPFYADVDLSRGGSIWFRESTRFDLLSRMDREISSNFPNANFRSRSLFIVTFDSVAYYKIPPDPSTANGAGGSASPSNGPNSNTANTINGIINGNNTFQLIVASDGSSSFVSILYPSNGIQWIRAEGKAKNFPDAKAQAGFIGPNGQLTTLRGSGSDQVFNLDKVSNLVAPSPGVWLFKVGKFDGLVAEPVSNYNALSSRENCSKTNHPCIPSATCQDREQGTCCTCKDGYVGNGISCFPIDAPQRINGKVVGKINDKQLSVINPQTGDEVPVNLHSYSAPEEGRSYTALSPVPNEVGSDLLSLLAIGDIVGWLFAKTTPGVPNGFMLTGGTFNRTVDIEFPQTGDRVTINERFLGPDIYNNLKVAIEIRGSLPKILPGSKLELTEFIYDYKIYQTLRERVVLRSKSARKYKLENGLEQPFNMEQSISYNQCPFRTLDEMPKPFRLETTKNFAVFDSGSEMHVVRFSGAYKTLAALDEDPCTTSQLTCVKYSSCVVDNNTPRCICDRGFTTKYANGNAAQITCVDINECNGHHRCHPNADCFNTEGSYSCKCRPGYAGNGYFCQAQLSCDSGVGCDVNAECFINSTSSLPDCKCKEGFFGNGYYCVKSEDENRPDCRSPESPCPENASCIATQHGGKHLCICKSGYIGNGYSCQLLSTATCDPPCSKDALCAFNGTASTNQCQCYPGFFGNGFNCIRETQLHTCINDTECHTKAKCQYAPDAQVKYCTCNDGYIGDGKYCARTEVDRTELDCKVNQVCSEDANCLYNALEERYSCKCRDGFHGNGVVCDPLKACISERDCPTNGKCTISMSNRGYCICNEGYNRTELTNGVFTCQPLPNAPCNLVANCHEKAGCVLDAATKRFECQCKRGYKGDGYNCEKTIVPCNILNTCDVRAKCTYSLDEKRYLCQCLEGWVGDGHTCTPNLPCNEHPSQCDQNADCKFLSHLGRHSCECRNGFIGDGLSCSPMPSYDGDYLIFAQGMSLLRLPLTPTEENPGQLLITKSHSTPVSLDIDCVKGYVYWSDVNSRKVYRAPYNGSVIEEATEVPAVSPEGLAVDWVSRNIYWVDTVSDAIFVAKLGAKNQVKKLINEGLRDPRDIAVHPGIGKIYWTDWNRDAPKIEYSNMDGSERRLFVDSDVGLPNMLTIDYSTGDLCWTDAELHRIECADLHGQNRRTMYTPVEYPFGLTCAGNFIFWTDWKSNSVDKVSRLGGQAQSLHMPPGGNGRVYDIVTVPKNCPQMSNACAINNGGCEHLCLPNAQGGRTCVCPDGDESCPVGA